MNEDPGFYFLETTDPLYDAIWKQIGVEFGDPNLVCEDPDTGECWQYMGTIPGRRTVSGHLIHQFRHRSIPAGTGRAPIGSERFTPYIGGERLYVNVGSFFTDDGALAVYTERVNVR